MVTGEADDRPLAGVTVLVLRARHQAAALVERLEERGASVVAAPVLQISPGNASAMRHAARELAEGRFDAIGFTSTNAIDAFAEALGSEGLDARILAGVFVACVGPATASSLEDALGVRPDLVPDHSTSQTLGRAFPVGPGHVLLPRGDLAGPELPTALGAKGWVVDEVVAYRTQTAKRLPREVLVALADGTIDVVALTSGSTAHAFHRLLAGRPSHAAAISIGPATSAACHQVGIEVAAEASRHDLDGLVAAIVDHVRPEEQPRQRRRSGAPWPSEQTVERMEALDDVRVERPVPVRDALGFALGVGALGGALAALKPWEWDQDDA